MKRNRVESKNRMMAFCAVAFCLAVLQVGVFQPLRAQTGPESLRTGGSETLLDSLRGLRAGSGTDLERVEMESRLNDARDLFTRLQGTIQEEHASGNLAAEEAATRLVGGFAELAFLMEDGGHYGGAVQIYQGALPLVRGTLQEIEMLKGIARCAEWAGDAVTARLAYEAIAEHSLFLQVRDELVPAHEYVVWKLMGETPGSAGQGKAERGAVSKLVERLLTSGDGELLLQAQERLEALPAEGRSWLAPLAMSLGDRRAELEGSQDRPGGGLDRAAAGSGMDLATSADLLQGLAANFEALVAGE